MQGRVLEIEGLRTTFSTSAGKVQAVRGIDLHVDKGEILGIVGESGSGKSVCMKSIMGLLPGSAHIQAEKILYKGEDLQQKKEDELRRFRGSEMAMVFQDPMTAMNPLRKVGYHLIEIICRYRKCSKKEAERIGIEMLRQVGISTPERRMKQYPHEFSGGMRQRALIAMALCCEPSLLVADEPTTALDVTIQAQILELLKKLHRERDMSIVLISHDMGVMAGMCTRIAVMYGGLLVEEGSVDEVFYRPRHPYTKALLHSVPRPEMKKDGKLYAIAGAVPSLHDPHVGCPFAGRCDYTQEVCKKELPEYISYTETQRARCVIDERGEG